MYEELVARCHANARNGISPKDIAFCRKWIAEHIGRTESKRIYNPWYYALC